MARVNVWLGYDSVALSPTESHISILPFGNMAWKMGTTGVPATGLHWPDIPGSALTAVAENVGSWSPIFLDLAAPGSTPVSRMILPLFSAVLRSITWMGVLARSCSACAAP
jgi:hypothetical protein